MAKAEPHEPLWGQLADEIDAYLAREPDVVQEPVHAHDEGLWS